MNFEQVIKKALLKEQEERKNRERSGMWTPSRFGRCFRHQFYSRRNEPESNPADVEFLKRCKLGSLIHQYAQSFFPAENCEVKVSKDDVLGYCDLVEENKVKDFKSVSDWDFNKIIQRDYDVEKQKETNCFQVATYGWILGLPLAGLVFINTKNLHSIEFEIKVEKFIPKIEEELKILRGYWEKQELPPAIPRAYGGKDCDYCCFRDTCLKMEKK